MDEIKRLLAEAEAEGGAREDWDRGYAAGLRAALDALARAQSTPQPPAPPADHP